MVEINEKSRFLDVNNAIQTKKLIQVNKNKTNLIRMLQKVRVNIFNTINIYFLNENNENIATTPKYVKKSMTLKRVKRYSVKASNYLATLTHSNEYECRKQCQNCQDI